MEGVMDLFRRPKHMIDGVQILEEDGKVAAADAGDKDMELATVATENDDSNASSAHQQQTGKTLATIEHSKVFVLIQATRQSLTEGEDAFTFVLGSTMMKARFLGYEFPPGTERLTVAAKLPVTPMIGALNSNFFKSVSTQANPTKFYVRPPPDVRSGDVFSVVLFGEKLSLRCPEAPNPPGGCCRKIVQACCCRNRMNNDHLLQFHIPPDYTTKKPDDERILGGVLCARTSAGYASPISAAASGSPEEEEEKAGIKQILGSEPPAFLVPIPKGIKPGQQFPVTIDGQKLLVSCPYKGRPGRLVRVVPPPPPVTRPMKTDEENKKIQLYEVVAPRNLGQGEEFAVAAGGNVVIIKSPTEVMGGQKIRFRMPVVPSGGGGGGGLAVWPKALCEKPHWTRAVLASNLQMRWIPSLEDLNDPDSGLNKNKKRFGINKSAYLPQLKCHYGDSSNLPKGNIVSLVPAEEVDLNTKVNGIFGKSLISYEDISGVLSKPFPDKVEWFQDKCSKKLWRARRDDEARLWNVGNSQQYIRMNIRLDHLLEDSLDAVMSLTKTSLRAPWRFDFIHSEEGGIPLDGGCSREWFRLVCEEIFDQGMGLWVPSESNPKVMTINPDSEFCCSNHLKWFRFFGRVLGRALYDGHVITGARMAKHIYKFLLQWPLQFEDLDKDYFNSLAQLQQMVSQGEDISILCLDFTTISNINGVRKEIELKEGGKDIEVTNENLHEYMEAFFKYKMLGKTQQQLAELMLGFHEVIPAPFFMAFDIQEFETLIHGLEDIDMVDWKESTNYQGAFQKTGADHPTCQWFWEIVEDMDPWMTAWLLDRATGSSVPPQSGFRFLTGNDGYFHRFTIRSADTTSPFGQGGGKGKIRFHPETNCIELPIVGNRAELRGMLMEHVRYPAAVCYDDDK